MIGKPQWFARRKYTGWGFSPRTWQGWVYLVVIILPILIVSQLQVSSTALTVFLIVWAGMFALDFIDIIIHLQKDERERIHEAIAERNALWVIITVLAIGIAYQAASSTVYHDVVKVDPVILIALGAGLIAKIISNIYLDKKD
jgi:hypothetical protein